MPACTLAPADTALPSGLIGYLDCQARTIGAGGWYALAAPGSTAYVFTTALLTLFVALLGYRLLFGERLDARDGVLAFVKIGIVLTLTTSWPAYRTLIYDVVLTAPAQLVAEVGGASGLAGASGDLATRLDAVDRAFEALTVYGAGAIQIANTAGPRAAPPPFGNFDAFAFNVARFAFLAGALLAFIVVRLGAGMLLAVGPLFVAPLLFGVGRGLFESWLRALVGVAAGAFATGIVLGVELGLFEPWLDTLLARRTAGLSITGAPAQLLALSTIFATAHLMLLAGALRFAGSLRLIGGHRGERERVTTSSSTGNAASLVRSSETVQERSRAAAIVDAVAAVQRREALASGGAGAGTTTIAGTDAPPRSYAVAGASPIGTTGRSGTAGRRTALRRSASASSRDSRR